MEKDGSDQTGVRKSRGRGTEHTSPELMFWQSFFHALPQPVMILDPEYTVMAANLATFEVTGKTENEIVGRKCYELFHGTNQPSSPCPIEKLLPESWSPPTEIEAETFSRTFLVSCTPIHDGEGKISRILHLATDITDLKEARRALEESREQYRIHFPHVSDVVFCFDRESRIVNVSPSVERTLGYTPEELIGKTVSELPFLALDLPLVRLPDQVRGEDEAYEERRQDREDGPEGDIPEDVEDPGQGMEGVEEVIEH